MTDQKSIGVAVLIVPPCSRYCAGEAQQGAPALGGDCGFSFAGALVATLEAAAVVAGTVVLGAAVTAVVELSAVSSSPPQAARVSVASATAAARVKRGVRSVMSSDGSNPHLAISQIRGGESGRPRPTSRQMGLWSVCLSLRIGHGSGRRWSQ